jgi:hypothetical protein
MNRLKHEIADAAKRAEKRAREQKIVPVYDLKGEKVGAITVPGGQEPPDQIRSMDARAAEKVGIHSVDEADKAGRTDLLRCFLLSRTLPQRYVEVVGGHDRAPDAPVSSQWKYDFTGYEAIHKRSNEIWELFPEGEITFLESILLAFMRDLFERKLAPEECGPIFEEFCKATGIAARFGPRFVTEHVARCGPLGRRLDELEAAAKTTAS